MLVPCLPMGRVPICLHLGWASLSLDSPARWPCPLSTGIGGNRAPSPHLQVGCVFHIFSLDLIGWGGDLLINFRVPLFVGFGGGLYYYYSHSGEWLFNRGGL